MMFDESFKEAIRNRKYHRPNNYELPPESVFGWKEAMMLLDTHPDSQRVLNGSKLSFTLTAIERRNSAPAFVKDIIKELKSTFPSNTITSHFFGGFTNKSKSFRIHRDTMDVLYLQVLGNVEWSMWEPKDVEYYKDDAKKNLSKEEANLLYTSTFKPGSMIWVPRGQYHLVEPYGTRLGISFGIEGNIEASLSRNVRVSKNV